ncbi:GNAT family N-acetyltransferase [Elioraea sp.]|uniref:GNAT family N-acetyltransferase n=1 Tax=Elioraea sp. TaxID=2185103 RepID=UPI0025BD373C|nr:GNAT family N-acetyltransferase [Elioraea sp.]
MTTAAGITVLTDGFHDIPPGRIATVVTHLEMTTRPSHAFVAQQRPGWSLRHETSLSPESYRALFRRIGEPWLWFSRLSLGDEQLTNHLADPASLIWVFESEGEDAGLVELSWREPGTCELVFFGVIPDLIGSGAGRFMMSHAILAAWARPQVTRVTVHTCTLDHPSALPFYMRAGFRPVRQQVEIAPDPRLAGTLTAAAAPHVPLIATAG